MRHILLNPDDVLQKGDEIYNCGVWVTIHSDAYGIHAGVSLIRRRLPALEWQKASDNTVRCWVSDCKHVLSDMASFKLIGEPHHKQIRATHWMIDTGLPMPGLPAPEKSSEELAFDEWVAEHWPLSSAADISVSCVERARKAFLAAREGAK